MGARLSIADAPMEEKSRELLPTSLVVDSSALMAFDEMWRNGCRQSFAACIAHLSRVGDIHEARLPSLGADRGR